MRPIPPELLERFDEESLKTLYLWLRESLRAETVSRDEYHEILSRLDRLEEGYTGLKEEVYLLRTEFRAFQGEMNRRFDTLRSDMDGRFDRMNERFDRMFDQMNERFDRMFDRMDERFDQMNGRLLTVFRWSVGLITVFGVLISILVALS